MLLFLVSILNFSLVLSFLNAEKSNILAADLPQGTCINPAPHEEMCQDIILTHAKPDTTNKYLFIIGNYGIDKTNSEIAPPTNRTKKENVYTGTKNVTSITLNTSSFYSPETDGENNVESIQVNII